ncbi:MAG: polysaccharide pyruvyl transferase family protein [Deltaproteobacteria bacterium]|nr:polysaccharide pyruvyl transferase family protein [Deltaproteobacteria bacterium]
MSPTATLFGSNSGNNLGDAAILSSILWNYRNKGFKFLVPTPNPSFVNLYRHLGNVRAVDIHPLRTLSVRFLGLTTINALRNSNYSLICDGILFGKRLFNPSFNFLSNLYILLPVLKALKVRLVCFACGLGPFDSKLSRKMARAVLEYCDLLLLRDDESIRLAIDLLGNEKQIRIERVGDCAFINPISPEHVAEKIFEIYGISGHTLVGVNITSYLGSWVGARTRKEEFFSKLEKTLIDVKKAFDLQYVFFSTHPMDNKANNEVAARTSSIFIPAGKFLSHDIMSVMAKCSAFIGMRFHSLILAAAAGVPVLGIRYAPKVGSLLKMLGSENLLVEIDNIQDMGYPFRFLLNNLSSIKDSQQVAVNREKQLALKAFEIFEQYAQSEHLGEFSLN